QLATIEYARNVLNLSDAHSTEIKMSTKNPVIDISPDKIDLDDLGGTLRLGSYPCKLKENTKVKQAYNQDEIHERHRHRYEFNNEYRDALEEKGLIVSGTSPD